MNTQKEAKDVIEIVTPNHTGVYVTFFSHTLRLGGGGDETWNVFSTTMVGLFSLGNTSVYK